MAMNLAAWLLCAAVLLSSAGEAGGSKRKWTKETSCEGCKWLHAKLRLEHQKIDPHVRMYGGGFKRVSRKERATMAIDRWCDGIAQIVYTNSPPVGQDDVFAFEASDIRMLELQCKKLQEKYRLRAVSLLSSFEANAQVPLSILCQDECYSKKAKQGAAKKPGGSTNGSPKAPQRPVPSDDDIKSYSV
eukprot:TRINITY_DN12305_c0_g2_i1.p1 TRINITY_DN12305_c0_g2~~TRINITY_DN12305_c0_g2_i1.p1  ORF type:complete len:188 (+),score=53.11 TRINITY_DN12305_c0_g2_i1:208-771(+)